MFAVPPISTDIVLTQPAWDFYGSVRLGSAKFGSKCLVAWPDIDILSYLQASAVRNQPTSAESLIEAIESLERDWDGYGALAISPVVCVNAKRFLSSSPTELSNPEITPTSNGTMNFEWASNNADAYLDIGQSRYTGHIQTKDGATIYLDGSLTDENNRDSGGIQQALALISGLLHATPSTPSIAQSL
jgi:hypothetical protein